MKNNDTIKTILKYVVLPLVLIVVAIVLFDNIKIVTNKSNEKRYGSIEEFLDNTNIEVNIPEGIYNCTDSEVIYSNGPFIQIGCEHFVLKISTFVNYNADTLDLYNYVSSVDNKYMVSNSDKKFVRYRIGCETLENCTVINWVDKDLAYGAILDGIKTEEEIMNLLGVDIENLSIFTEEQTEETVEKIYNETVQIKIEDRYALTLPATKVEVVSVEASNGVIFYINNEKVFMILDGTDGATGAVENINLRHGYILEYVKQNPFIEGTDEFVSFDKIISNIKDIANNIDYN